jgi:hypothetical protein
MHSNNVFRIGFVFGLLILFTVLSSILSTEGIAAEENESYTAISGLYYLRDDDPLNRVDVGSLLKSLPAENEITQCGMFINFHFAQPGFYVGNNTIFNIYYRFWQKRDTLAVYKIGYGTSSNHTAGFNESLWVDTNDYICEVNNYRLVQAMQFTNPEIAIFEDNEIYNFTIKFFGSNPNTLCYPNQYSFVILNLEDNSTLRNYDRDIDLLNDFDELFVYYTNPFDSDSDNDGYSDYSESIIETDPNDFTDNLGINTHPNIPTIIGPLSGKADKIYEYKFLSTDPEDQDISFFVDWDDNTSTYWAGYITSGAEVTLAHTWSELRTYTIKAKAKDIYGAESQWATFEVKIERKSREVQQMLFYRFLEQFPIIQKILDFIL